MVDLHIHGPITVIVQEDAGEGTRAALARIEMVLAGIDSRTRKSNVNEAESLALLGEIRAESDDQSAKLTTVVEKLTETDADIDELIALAQRPEVPTALADGLTALKAKLSDQGTVVSDVAERAAALASAYTPPEVPTTPPGEVPGETPVPGDGTGSGGANPPADGTGDGSGAGGTGDVTGTGDGTIPAGGANV